MSKTLKTITITFEKLCDIHKALIEARESTIEMMNTHVNVNGLDTKKNRFIADMYENEVRNLGHLIDYTNSLGG